jgi:hypothetical protein
MGGAYKQAQVDEASKAIYYGKGLKQLGNRQPTASADAYVCRDLGALTRQRAVGTEAQMFDLSLPARKATCLGLGQCREICCLELHVD